MTTGPQLAGAFCALLASGDGDGLVMFIDDLEPDDAKAILVEFANALRGNLEQVEVARQAAASASGIPSDLMAELGRQRAGEELRRRIARDGD